jgi:hypothetical protein
VVNVAFRSDVLGQVMPLVGRDWSQSGVARLFSAIKVWKQTILSFCFRFPLSFSEIVPSFAQTLSDDSYFPTRKTVIN